MRWYATAIAAALTLVCLAGCEGTGAAPKAAPTPVSSPTVTAPSAGGTSDTTPTFSPQSGFTLSVPEGVTVVNQIDVPASELAKPELEGILGAKPTAIHFTTLQAGGKPAVVAAYTFADARTAQSAMASHGGGPLKIGSYTYGDAPTARSVAALQGRHGPITQFANGNQMIVAAGDPTVADSVRKQVRPPALR